ncbi:hypothetical protein [Weissella cibaria]|uniref:hypothetical protein n=1 Tax=Weissella cibaria TaxID=137591 RepID=UPI00223BA5F0|nr:hypothetical protein [Weissella cibaria]MCT0954511.1 hypothetical protein [Weissella cibaria]
MNRVVVYRKKLKTDRLGALQQWFAEIESITNGKESLKNTEVGMPVIEDFKNWDALEEALQLIHKGYSLTDEASLPVKLGRGEKVPVAIDWARTINSQHNGSVQDWIVAYKNEHKEAKITAFDYYDWMYQVYNYGLVDPRDLPTLNHENVHLLSQEANFIAEVSDDWSNPTLYEAKPIFFIQHFFAHTEDMENKHAKVIKERRNFLKGDPNFCTNKTETEIRMEILDDVKKVLLTGKPKIVTTIPSSTPGKTSEIQKIIVDLSREYPREILDGSQLIVRTQKKPKSHAHKSVKSTDSEEEKQLFIEANSVKTNISTMRVDKAILANVKQDTDIVVLDDFVTKSTSFVAVDILLDKNLPGWNYTNLAYAKTASNFKQATVDQYAEILEGTLVTDYQTGPLLGAIFDLDNTIIDSDSYYREVAAMGSIAGDIKVNPLIKLPFNTGVDFDHVNLELLKLKEFIQTSVVTNRDWNNTKVFIKSQLVYKNLFNVGQYETKEGNNKNILFYQDSEWVMTGAKKPDITTLNKMVEKIRDGKQGRIIGFGNQESDILAYRAAGVEPYLVTVYNKVAFNNTFGLDDDHVLDSEEKIRGLVDQLRQTHQAESENVKMDELDVYEFDPDFDIMEPEF